MKLSTYLLFAGSILAVPLHGFTLQRISQRHSIKDSVSKNTVGIRDQVCAYAEKWTGEVVTGGKIQGCSIQLVAGSVTEWIVTIDGIEADLGRFSQAIYKKITTDAKQQRFQGFRPGTIPPHLEPTYRAFTMDECARETVLEALQQNNIRPFESARNEMSIDSISFPPPPPKRSKKTKKATSKEADTQEGEEATPEWLTKKTIKDAIDAGWQPGQSFSFVANGVKGQKVKDQDTSGATSLGANY